MNLATYLFWQMNYVAQWNLWNSKKNYRQANFPCTDRPTSLYHSGFRISTTRSNNKQKNKNHYYCCAHKDNRYESWYIANVSDHHEGCDFHWPKKDPFILEAHYNLTNKLIGEAVDTSDYYFIYYLKEMERLNKNGIMSTLYICPGHKHFLDYVISHISLLLSWLE